MMEIKYKRVLIINDDDTEADFFNTYKNLQPCKSMVSYCNDPVSAFAYITSDDFGGFDKIILDIRMEWTVPEEYIHKVNECIDAKAMGNTNMGFLIFMYLISRGYPINRIAFLSAYITEEDDEYEEKNRILHMIETWKKRDAEKDEEIRRHADKVPSIRKRILNILDNKNYLEMKAYKEIKKLLMQDIGSLHESRPSRNGEVENNNEDFFRLLTATGLKVENKIHKKDGDKLAEWIEREKSDELRAYYEFRNMAFNICEYTKGGEPVIYGLCKDSEKKRFKQRYPESYFKDLMQTIQYDISAFREDKDIERIAENMIGSLTAFWEGLDKRIIKAGASQPQINEHALTMVLKHIRNWHAHGRIEKYGIKFCRFIFLISVRVIYDRIEDMETYVEKELKLENVRIDADEEYYRKIWKDINDRITSTKGSRTNTCTVDIADLYYKYSHDKARDEITLSISDLYEMFILCLHFPDVFLSDDQYGTLRIAFHEIDYNNQERYMIFLEKMAMDGLGKAI